MSLFKSLTQFILVFGALALPAFIFYQSPQSEKVTMKWTKTQRGIASLGTPAMKTCEMVQRVRWRCREPENCYRDGFDKVRVCKPLK